MCSYGNSWFIQGEFNIFKMFKQNIGLYTQSNIYQSYKN